MDINCVVFRAFGAPPPADRRHVLRGLIVGGASAVRVPIKYSTAMLKLSSKHAAARSYKKVHHCKVKIVRLVCYTYLSICRCTYTISQHITIWYCIYYAGYSLHSYTGLLAPLPARLQLPVIYCYCTHVTSRPLSIGHECALCTPIGC